MNVQEHIEGIRGDDLAAIDNAGLDRKAIAARGVDAMLKMILVDGFFQADPHPGNVMCLPGNRIALIDFGMVGRLSPARRRQMVDLLAGFVRHDEETMLEVLLDWRGNETVNEARLAADLGELAFDYSDAQLKDLESGRCCTGYRRSCASTRSCCRRISPSSSRRSSLSRVRPPIRSRVPSGRPGGAVSQPCHVRALSAGGRVAPGPGDAQRFFGACRLDAA